MKGGIVLAGEHDRIRFPSGVEHGELSAAGAPEPELYPAGKKSSGVLDLNIRQCSVRNASAPAGATELRRVQHELLALGGDRRAQFPFVHSHHCCTPSAASGVVLRVASSLVGKGTQLL